MRRQAGRVLSVCLLCLASSTGIQFFPRDSRSFQWTNKTFRTAFADGTTLAGQVCSDQVQLGRSHSRAEFVCLEHGRSNPVWQFDGILGLGIPDPDDWRDSLLAWLSTSHQPAGGEGRVPMQRLLYSVLMTMDGGEVQLGGYLRQSVLRPPILLPVLPLYCPHRAANGQRNGTGLERINGSPIAHSRQSGVDNPRQCMYRHYTVNVQVLASCSGAGVYCTCRHCMLVTSCCCKTIPALWIVVCTTRSTARL